MKSTAFKIVLLIAILSFHNCSDDQENPKTNITTKVISIDSETLFQTIAGFGGANKMWTTDTLSSSEIQHIFGTDDLSLGLSIFRVRIAPNPEDWPIMVASLKQIENLGITIIASPWSPPANLKSNDNTTGGYLLPENYEAYKNHLNAYIKYMADQGVFIDVISIQNEPDIEVSYESCDWTAQQMADFIKNYGQELAVKVMAPESYKFDQNYINLLLNDPEVEENIAIIGGHIYGSGLDFITSATYYNKEIWMTEYLLNMNTGNSSSPAWNTYSEAAIWEETLEMLNSIHEAMNYNWNAYNWWYIKRYYSFIGDGTQGTIQGDILKRGYAFSHYSKFVRPGFVRVKVNNEEGLDLKVTAFETNSQLVLVILNDSNSAETHVQFNVPTISTVKAYQSTVTENSTAINIDSNTNSVTINIVPKKSITTIVIDKN